MVKRIAAIIFIYICATVAWIILGATIMDRTYSTDDRMKDKVSSNWGMPQTQKPPTAMYSRTDEVNVEETVDGRKVIRKDHRTTTLALPLDRSGIGVWFHLDHRQKGLLWYATYNVKFDGDYSFRVAAEKPGEVKVTIPFPAQQAIYDDLVLTVNGKPEPFSNDGNGLATVVAASAGETVVVHVGYKSQGLDRWAYSFGDDVSQVREFRLVMNTDFKDIDFPENTLSPTEKKEAGNGWVLTWNYTSLLSGFQIGMEMPQKLQPGPLAGQISFFAPVSLLFFFFLMFIITTLRGIDLHPMNYFFLAAAFFAFHLLLAYTADHISIHAAFAISSAVSIFLVISYLRLVVGMRFAAVEAGISQLIYLVLFSYAFFFKGFTGLAITIGSVVTLFVVMQMTGRIRWSDRFAKPTRETGTAAGA